MTTANHRTSDYPVDPLFLERWSPRAFSGAAMPETDLLSMIEAARWAASAYNSQPWSFLYALRDTEAWPKFLDLLVPFNLSWAEHAAAVVIVVSNSLMVPPGRDKPVPSHSHSFDTGMATAQFVLQGTKLGYHSHGMVGLDMERAFAELNVPVGHRVEAAFAVGRIGERSSLPDALQAREQPSNRNAISSIALNGGFPAPGAA
ncbi:nitroreductase family protein [Lichenihabitans sp. Uapishka_5]|uniref:nitroreductase family protein n=1 Tax=Lichenihabitans sp. Uapishka_5 TaxID=3037302 RepID=UPI0029E803F4|nr:nitroreductase family protein [Lichenihabitans sp. Uapishka_5]MDX7950956.1 nitroreductase family protein [Lichenihabitans sp. Uapishka_5]